jgi:crossover junction endodeoxyribonuclease RuvC
VNVVGIDPGITGALAIHTDGRLTVVMDMPVYDGRTDGAALRDILHFWEPDVVYLERTQAMPKNGVIASFSLGMNSGIIIGVLAGMSHPFVRVRPQDWKSKLGVSRLDKNALRGIVREIYPEKASEFARVKDHNRAEAVLISRYGVAMQVQEANAS